MKEKTTIMNTWLRSCLLLLAVIAHPAYAAESVLKVGAARVDITPPIEELPPPYKAIFDKIYLRALVLDNGSTRAAMVVADVPMIQAGNFAELSRRISQQAKVPPENVLLGNTHTHNSIRVDGDGVHIILPGSQKFVDRIMAATERAIKEAVANLQPARAGYAVGNAHLIANRNEWFPAQNRYIDGIDRSGSQPVDASLGVFKFETLSGEPIAFVLNYGIEPVVSMASPTEISGDVPGATSRYIEEKFADKAVAIFTIGPAASPLYRVRPDPQLGKADVDRAHKIVNAMGTILGEEALAAAKDSKLTSNLRIAAAKRILQCPGKNTTPFNLRTQCAYTPDSKLPACDFKDTDSEPVNLSMWLLKIGDVAFVQADANVSSELGEKLHHASPLANTLIVALNFGPARFVVDEASYPLNTYEATATRFKRGCAEQGFLDNALQMIEQLR
jgi:hypothetical protein